MSHYYCHACAVKKGLVTPTITANLTGTNYQLDKFIKHTAPTGNYAMNSVFNDPKYPTYRDYTISGALSGCVEVDNKGRSNIIWYAGKETGLTYSGNFNLPVSGIKIVLHQDNAKIHAYPFQVPETKHCQDCGVLIPY